MITVLWSNRNSMVNLDISTRIGKQIFRVKYIAQKKKQQSYTSSKYFVRWWRKGTRNSEKNHCERKTECKNVPKSI